MPTPSIRRKGRGFLPQNPAVAQLLQQLQVSRGSVRLLDSDGRTRDTGALQAGDHIELSAPGESTAQLFPCADPRRHWRQSSPRSKYADGIIGCTDPAPIYCRPAHARCYGPDHDTFRYTRHAYGNTYINVIGRGEVLLRDLPTQSIGRTGSAYSYKRVGTFQLEPGAGGSTVLTLRHLDLRPANGADVVLRISGARIDRAGTYVFSARYETKEPASYSSPGTGSERARLTITHTISDLARLPLNPLHYQEAPDLYTTTSLCWGGSAGPFALEQSTRWPALGAGESSAQGAGECGARFRAWLPTAFITSGCG
jgi:hypothetical protein